MSDFRRLAATLAYARLGLVSLTAAIAPIAGAAQELCGVDLFEGEPDADILMERTMAFLDILEEGGIVAFDGQEGRVTLDGAREALREGVGSASLLACVVDAEAIVVDAEGDGHIIRCGTEGAAALVSPLRADIAPPSRPWPVVGAVETAALGQQTGALFCTPEIASFAQYMGSQA